MAKKRILSQILTSEEISTITEGSSLKTNVIPNNAKNRGGRPKKTSTDKQDKKINIYMTAKELEDLKVFCEENELQISTYVREIILKSIKKQ